MAIKDNRRNSAAVQPASAGGAGGGSGGVSAERAAGVSGRRGCLALIENALQHRPAAESWAFGRWPAWLSVQ